ncbi:MAG: TetR/AcrR family transcriptional regulator [Actinomycetota bacterium]|nr:TetR/AcrR family transcriptional regulator [Actinomycetota bacterium]
MEQRQPNTDGRIARGERTRESIVAAHTALLREGNLKPTGKVIAERAGVSVRTLWLNFKDLESLLGESTAYWLADDEALWHPIDPGLPLGDRITQFCQQRSRRLENIAPAARAAALGEPFSPALQASRRRHVERVRHDIEVTFAPELSSDGTDQREQLVIGLAVAASWSAWQLLRDDYGVAVSEATAVMRNTIGILLGL